MSEFNQRVVVNAEDMGEPMPELQSLMYRFDEAIKHMQDNVMGIIKHADVLSPMKDEMFKEDSSHSEIKGVGAIGALQQQIMRIELENRRLSIALAHLRKLV